MTCPMDYHLCNQTVTVYRKAQDTVCRQVIPNAYFAAEQGVSHTNLGQDKKRSFLLIVPGPQVQIFVGDRVLPGVGPQDVDWNTFVPSQVEDLVEVGRTRHYRWDGKICHVEAQDAWN